MDKWPPTKDEPAAKPAHEKSAFNAESKPRSNRMYWIAGGAVVALLLTFFVFVPAFRGYGIYSAMKKADVPQEYFTNMVALSDAKATAEQQAASATAERDAANQQLNTCQQEKATVETNIQTQKTNYEERLAAEQDRADAAEEEAESKTAALENAARRICCIARVENPSINAYAIIDDKVTCVSEGGTSISC
jgi:hypothetical protein